jgi:tRNA(Ile)-lysidine synthetase-like protein
MADMEMHVQPGRYVVAVSGGVDSVVLLDALVQQPGLELVVAHFDHGIRPDSALDAAFVSELAARYGLPFVTERVELGAGASENAAREARYAFLRHVQQAQGARAIITAHHQDDVLETAIFNLLRGTGRKGLSSLRSTPEIVRPLLDTPKAALKAHAVQQKLSWREDSTNHDDRYTRNYIRHRLLVRFDADARQRLLALIKRQQVINDELDELLAVHTTELDRRWFASLPYATAKEVMAAWLRSNGPANFDHRTIDRLTVQAKTKPIGKQLDVLNGYKIAVQAQSLALLAPER